MCLTDVKMRWQFGGNLQPVRMICEFDWSECPIAIANYVWSEIVTDVVDCLTNEAVLWRIIAMLFVCTMLLHTICCKTRWVDETALNKESLNRVDFKVRDLELKVNVLTYKMQYGTWPLPHQIQANSLDEPRKVRLTLSNGNQRNSWSRHLMLSSERDTIRVPCQKVKPPSAKCLKKLIDLETKYVSSKFQRDVSPVDSNVARSSITASERSTGCPKRIVRSPEKKNLKQRQMSKSENLGLRHRGVKFGLRLGRERVDCSSETQTRNGTELRLASNDPGSYDEKLAKAASECKRFMEELKNSNKSLGLIGSSSQISERYTTKNICVGTQSVRQGQIVGLTNNVDKSADKKEDEKSCENDVNTSNGVHSIAKFGKFTLHRLPVEDPNCHSVEDRVFHGSKPKLLPSGLSINFRRISSTNEVPEASTGVRQRQDLRDPTCETLYQVRERLESLHKVLRNYEAQDTRKCSTKMFEGTTNERDDAMDMIFQNLNNFENGYDEITFDVDQQGNLKKDRHNSSSEYEQYDTEQTNRSTLSSISVENYINIFDIQREDFISDQKMTRRSVWMDDRAEPSSLIRKSSSIEWVHEEFQHSENRYQDDIVYMRTLNNNDLVDKAEIRDYNDINDDVSSENSKETGSSNLQEVTNGQEKENTLTSNSLTSGSSEHDNSTGKGSSKSKSKSEFSKNSIFQTCEISPLDSYSVSKKHTEPCVSSDDTSECLVPMEIEDDLIVISRTSSQTEFSKESDLDDKSTATLLREALKFKKALLSQIELDNEVDLPREQVMTKENIECEMDSGTKLRIENQFQSKLLDIISEEQSASSCTEKISKTYILMQMSKERNLTNFSTVDNATANVEEQSCDIINHDHTSREDSKLISASSEYFSLSNVVDDKDADTQEWKNDSFSRWELLQSCRNVDDSNVRKSKTMLKTVMESPRSENTGKMKERVDDPTITQMENRIEEEFINNNKLVDDERIIKIEEVTEKIMTNLKKDNIKELNNNVDDITVHDDDVEELQGAKACEETGPIRDVVDEFANGGQNSEGNIDESAPRQRVKNINELVYQNAQNMRNYTEIFSQKQNNAILQTRKALLQQKGDWNLNYLEPDNQIPWNQMTESSSDESITRFTKALANKDTKSIEIIAEHELTSNSISLEGQNVIATKESSECKSNLTLKRRPGTFFLGDTKMSDIKSRVSSNVFEIATDSDSLFKPVLSEVQDRNLTDTRRMHKSVSSYDNNLKYKNNLERKTDTYAKHKTLNVFTKSLDAGISNADKNEANECNSPLSGRTVICVVKNMTDFDDNSNTRNVKKSEKEMTKDSTTSDTILTGDNVSGCKENDARSSIPLDENKSPGSLKEANYVQLENHDEKTDSLHLNNREKHFEKVESNLNSQSGSLYFTDKASCSNVKLGIARGIDLNSNPNNAPETKETTGNAEKRTEPKNVQIKVTTSLKDQSPNIEESNGKDVGAKVCDVKSFDSKESSDSIKIINSTYREKSSDSCVLEKNCSCDERCALNKLTNNNYQSTVNNINLDDAIPRYCDETSNKNVENSNVIANSNNSMLPTTKAELDSLSSNINLSSNTSTSYVDASNQDFTTLSNNTLILERSTSNLPSSRIEKLVSNKPVHLSNTSMPSRFSWSPKKAMSIGNANVSKTKKQEKVVVEVEKSKSPVSVKKSNPNAKQRSLQDCQFIARSNLSLTNETRERHIGKSNIELPRRRSRSYATPRKSNASPRSIDTPPKLKKDRDTSQPKLISQPSKINDLISRPSSRSHASTPKTSSKSFIPVLKTKLKTTKKLECDPCPRSPTRSSLTIAMTNPWQKDSIRKVQTTEAVARMEDASLEISKDETSCEEESKEPCVALEKITFLEQTCPNVIPKECMVIYVNVVPEHDRVAARMVNSNKFLNYVRDRELSVQNIVDDNQVKDYRYDVGTSTSILECIEDTKSNVLTVVPAVTDKNDTNDENISTVSPFQMQHSTVNKLLSTSTLKGSWSFRVNQREIEVSAKPSVADISTSISDLPNMFEETRNMADESKLKAFEVPKELTKEEYIVLLEAINKDPNLLQFRKMHKLCNKLGLGFRE